MKIYNGYNRLNENYSLLTDDYEYKMAAGYLECNKEKMESVFDLYFRKVPNGGGFAVMAGLDQIIEYVKNLRFDEEKLDFFKRCGYSEKLINYLKNFKFTGDIYAIPDGTPVFPNEPLITVKAPVIEAVIMETALLSIVNGAMETATGARVIVEAAPRNVGIMEFGSRRAPGLAAAINSSIYAMMAGCVGTSNCMAADMLNKKAMGTMAHSWVETFPSELEAFKSFADIYPDNCMLLVDTYNTLNSGVPNAIKTFKYMEEKGLQTNNIGIRIDSGDLAYLSKSSRKMLDEAGFPQAKICLSNGLNAKSISSLVSQGAVFDSLGVGDNISHPDGRMGCVYKEVAIKENGTWVPKIKLSEDTVKIVNPGFKRLYRAFDKDSGYAIADVITKRDEKVSKDNLFIVSPQNALKNKTINNFELVELQQRIFADGKLIYNDPSLEEKAKYCEAQMARIYPEIKRTEMPHEHHVSGTKEYVDFKNELIEKTQRLVRERRK